MDFYEQSKSRGRHRDSRHAGKKKKPQLNRKKDNHLVQIYQDTQEFFRFFPRRELVPPELYDISKLDELAELSGPNSPRVEVCNEDTLDMAQRYHHAYGLCQDATDIFVLNMASKFKPGGGVRNGKTAQEEVIFRRTNAFMTHPESYYPLDDTEAIYSPEVRVIKDSQYNLLDKKEQFRVAMYAVHAIKNPRVRHNHLAEYSYLNRRDYELTRQKIESIFRVAALNKKKILVLGALGCGAYNNPVAEVVEIFREMLKKYKKYFDVIGFAVLARNATGQTNLELFQKL